MLKRGLVIGGAAIAGLLAIAGIASAASKPKPKPNGEGSSEPTDAGFKGPNKQQCQDWYDERVGYINQISNINAALYDIDAARIDAAGNGDDATLAQLDQQKASMISQRNTLQNKANDLAVKMQDCQ